jgi:hypothetical protein
MSVKFRDLPTYAKASHEIYENYIYPIGNRS